MKRFASLLIIILIASICSANAQQERRFSYGMVEEISIPSPIEMITNTPASFSFGLRIGLQGVYAIEEYAYRDNKCLEARLGYDWGIEGIWITVLHNWRTFKHNNLFLDFGCGIDFSPTHTPRVGIAAKIGVGYKLKNTPISLSLDYTPSILYNMNHREILSNLANIGISCTFNL